MAVVESGPIHIKLSLEQAIGILIKQLGLEEEIRQLIKEALQKQLEEQGEQDGKRIS